MRSASVDHPMTPTARPMVDADTRSADDAGQRVLGDHVQGRGGQGHAGVGGAVVDRHVIAVEMKDEPGGLFEIASKLSEAGINIEYSYAFSGKNKAILILRVDQVEEAIRLLHSQKFTLIASESIQ